MFIASVANPFVYGIWAAGVTETDSISRSILGAGNCLSCLLTTFVLVISICGSVWRWSEYGEICACADFACNDGVEKDLVGTGYYKSSGIFMDFWLKLTWIGSAIVIPLVLVIACCYVLM